jgi:nucleotide-binding universal stress UspA family protein
VNEKHNDCSFTLPQEKEFAMFERILVPLDGSTLAERALPHAEEFARIFKSHIILLQVLDPTSYHENSNPVDPLSWHIRKAEADTYLNGIAAHLRESLRGSVPMTRGKNEKNLVEYSIREGKTAENIVNFAQSENIDLVIISTHGSGGLSRWNISSVTQKVINLIYLPVLIVRAYHKSGSEEPRIHYRNILLPFDSSRRAECALSAGIALARGETSKGFLSKANNLLNRHTPPTSSPLKTKLLLAAVIRPPELPIPEPYPEEIEKLSERLMQLSHQVVSHYLNEMKERLTVECETCVVKNDSVSSAIQELANQKEDIDLVVLCAHGRTGQPTWSYGSVARNYLEHGTKNVLIIQDLRHTQVQPTDAEIAAEKSGGL